MPLTKDLTSNDFTKMDNKAYEALTNNAVIVYLSFAKAHPNTDPTDEYMTTKARMSINTYKRAKAELIKNGYLYVQRHGAKGAKITYHFGENAVKKIQKYLCKNGKVKL